MVLENAAGVIDGEMPCFDGHGVVQRELKIERSLENHLIARGVIGSEKLYAADFAISESVCHTKLMHLAVCEFCEEAQ